MAVPTPDSQLLLKRAATQRSTAGFAGGEAGLRLDSRKTFVP